MVIRTAEPNCSTAKGYLKREKRIPHDQSRLCAVTRL
jgi:hypothetical protein